MKPEDRFSDVDARSLVGAMSFHCRSQDRALLEHRRRVEAAVESKGPVVIRAKAKGKARPRDARARDDEIARTGAGS
jgi:hypothetical protein